MRTSRCDKCEVETDALPCFKCGGLVLRNDPGPSQLDRIEQKLNRQDVMRKALHKISSLDHDNIWGAYEIAREALK